MPSRTSVSIWRQPLLFMLFGACAIHSAAVQAEWLYREEAIMGTRCAVELWATDRTAGNAAIEAVLADMRRIDALMSTYKPDSEISRVNATAASEPVAVTAELFGLLQTAWQYSGLSKGAFDITYASVGYLYDYRRHFHPDEKDIAAALPAVDYRQLKLDPAKRTVAFGKPGMRIDLGGIAKGYAVDRGIQILKDRGFTHAMVNAGGDTRVSGDRFGKPWIVGIRHPDRKDEIADYERYFDEGAVRYHHIIDPKTGHSPHAVRSVTIIASNATRTDGLSKTVFILGPKAGIDFINSLPDADAIVIAADGKVSYSKGLQPPQ
jgi:thiamine biosynthesis lipoprotein